MTTVPNNTVLRARAPQGQPSGGAGSETGTTLDDFHADFGEELREVLSLKSWRAGRDLGEEYNCLEQMVRLAVDSESGDQRFIRNEVHPLLASMPGAPPGAGRYRVETAEIAEAHRGLLFNGAVECCDGSSNQHDTLALTIHQLGVALVSYCGTQDSWQLRLYRKDLSQRGPNPMDSVLELLERRSRRGGLHPTSRDVLSELAQRGLMTYAERAVLADEAQAPWRLGHGSPAPLELIGARFTDLVVESIKVIRRLIDHRRFVFVASEPSDRGLVTIGQGLYPLEYAIIGTLQDRIREYLEDWQPNHPATVDTNWDGKPLPPRDWVVRFRDEVAPQVVYGMYRATLLAPPQLFYAHVDHAHVAARIALADSVLLEQRGFPALIDLADRMCKSIYGGSSLNEMAAAAYAAAGAPFRYQSERATRQP